MLRDRFDQPADEFAMKFVASVAADEKLIPFDIRGSIAHARMLGEVGILSKEDSKALVAALAKLRIDKLDPADEDVHMSVEKKLGPIGAKLHAARSRNDQVALDLRLWLKDAVRTILDEIEALRGKLGPSKAVMPGVTHLQHAQPVTLGHVFACWKEQLGRDADRFRDCAKRADVSPLGACALAGTSLPIDPKRTAKELGFSKVFASSIDAVSDRDFAAEFAFACSMTMTHLSQIAEMLVLWSTPEFGFVELPDALCTSSSIMPQKKNPDMIELVRGKTGSVVGQLVSLLVTLKGLPLGYNRDLQETKPPLFEAAETTRLSLHAIGLAVAGLKADAKKMRASIEEAMFATDMAEELTRKGMPFREAHSAVAKLMKGGGKLKGFRITPEESVARRERSRK
jgi:argininosuccinate lyase